MNKGTWHWIDGKRVACRAILDDKGRITGYEPVEKTTPKAAKPKAKEK